MPVMQRKTALIAGASGLIGRRISDHLIAAGDWEVIGLARRPQPVPNMRWVAVDLTDPADCRGKADELAAVSHVFYAARYDHPEGRPESVEANAAMLSNLIAALELAAPGLRHVHAVHGSKYYGHQLGPVNLPMREDASPRAQLA